MSRETQMELADVRWRHYPHLDAALAAAAPAVLKGIEKTRAQIARIRREGTERERERARAADGAYARAMAIYERIVELQNVASNKGAGETITG